MSVTSTDLLGGLLVAVITGSRPQLKERPTAKHLAAVEALGVRDIVWVVSETDAPFYQRDDYQHAVYQREWAEEYAAEHWMGTKRPEPGAFLGAFPGREWACLEAERRGCWGVLQLDDNIKYLRVARGTLPGQRVAERNGGLGLFADLLAGVALSTNARMVGAYLSAVPKIPRSDWKVARAGFPYSLFVERVGPDREHWYGPFEDDITHAFQYGTRGDGVTAAVVPFLNYQKESQSQSGMRAVYNHTRAVQLQRIFPESAKINIRATRSNGRGLPRVFHTMIPGAIRNPLRVHDPDLFGAVKTRINGLVEEWHTEYLASNREKVLRRAKQQRIASQIAAGKLPAAPKAPTAGGES